MLKLNNISFEYSNKQRVFEGVSLALEKNELLVLQGKSGSGKSTFLKILNRFHPISSGSISLHGTDTAEYPVQELRSRLLYLPQLPTMISGTVGENLSFPFSLGIHRQKRFDGGKAKEWLDYFQLKATFDDDVHPFSVGEKQRLALIRGLLLEPEILLLDEPTSALDTENRQLIEEKVESLTQEGMTTVILVTHQETSFSSSHARFFTVEDMKLVAGSYLNRLPVNRQP